MTTDKLYRDHRDRDEDAHYSGGTPGKLATTARLAAGTRVVFRVENAEAATALGQAFGPRDPNGVAAGADAAVDRAAGSSGQPLPEDLRGRFESSLGADLSSVRVHTGGESAEASHAVGAKAYTTGQDIHFGEGHYDPSSAFGVHLLAHEVAHTVQQQGSAPTRQNKLEVSAPQDGAELEADRAADAMVRGASTTITTTGAGAQRQAADNGQESTQDAATTGDAGDNAAAEEEPTLADFTPAVTLAPTKLSVDSHDKGSVTATLTNAGDLPPDTTWTVEPSSPDAEAAATASEATGEGGARKISIDAVKPGSTTIAFQWAASAGDETSSAEAGSVAITVPMPTLEVVSSTAAGLMKPKEEVSFAVRVGHVKDPQTNADVTLSVDCGVSADQLNAPGTEKYPDAFVIGDSTWTKPDEIQVPVTAHHAGEGSLLVSATVGEDTIELTETLTCASDLESFKARCKNANLISTMIRSSVTTFLATLSANLKTAHGWHATVIKSHAAAQILMSKPMELALGTVWDIAKGAIVAAYPGAGFVIAAGEYMKKLSDAQATTLTVASLQAASASLPGFKAHITAAATSPGEATLENIDNFGMMVSANIDAICASTTMAWLEWAETADPTALVSFDPHDTLISKIPIATTPAPPSVGAYEEAIWRSWLSQGGASVCKANGDPSYGPGAHMVFADTPIGMRLMEYKIPFPNQPNPAPPPPKREWKEGDGGAPAH